MEKKSYFGLIIAIVFAALTIAGSIVFFALQGRMSEKDLQAEILKGIDTYVNGEAVVDEEELVEDQPFLGDEDAPVTIVEFSDYLCGYCRLFHEESWELLKKDYIETGKVKFVYRDFLLGYEGDYEAALAAECVRDQEGDEAFFEMHDFIFANVGNGLDMESYVSYAEELGLDGEEFRVCMEEEDFGDEIMADTEYGRSLKVRGTPGFFVNGEFVAGAIPYDDMAEMIEEKL